MTPHEHAPDSDELIKETIGALAEAEEAVGIELDLLRSAQSADSNRTGLLLDRVQDFSLQADALVVAMLDRQTDEDLMRVAEELAGFFRAAEEQIGAMLRASEK